MATNKVYEHYNNDWKKIVEKIRDSKNQHLILELLYSELQYNNEYNNIILNKDWKNICLNLEKIIESLSQESQTKFLVILTYLNDFVIPNLNAFNFYFNGLKKGKRIGYNSGYKEAIEGKENKYILSKKRKKDKLNNKKPISPFETLTNKRIQDWILGDYSSIKEAKDDCKYTSQTEAYLHLIKGENVFLTGPAGSGKSFVINQYANMLFAFNDKLNIVKTSTTGISATNIGGKTIHSFLTCEPEDYNKPYEEVKEKYLDLFPSRWKNGNKKLKEADVIIIDEISMMSEAFFNFFVNRYEDVKAKGQVIVCGDFSQLPPVAKKESIEKYGNSISKFSFDCEGWRKLKLRVCYLDKLYRTKDMKLSYILNEISLGRGNSEKVKELLLNLPQTNDKFKKGSALILPYNANVEQINKTEQDKNENILQCYIPKSRPDLVTDTNIKEEEKEINCQKIMIRDKCPSEISLKENDTIMITSNLYSKDLWPNDSGDNTLILANGTIGTMIYLENDEYPFGIKLKDGKIFNIPPKITSEGYYIKESTEDDKSEAIFICTGAYESLPMKLAYAITIHKSQGQSFSDVTCDLTSSFIKGLGYVALSRATDYSGITLLNQNNERIPFNYLSLEIDPQSLDIKQKTQIQAYENRKNSELLLESVFNSPLQYIEQLNSRRKKRNVKKKR